MILLPWFLPGACISLVIGVIASRRAAAAIGASRAVGGLLVVALGLVIAATLTPVPRGADETGVGTCDFGRIGLAPLEELATINDTTLNILLFVPLGVAVALVPGRGTRARLAGVAVALPFAIEAVQLVATTLHRGCQSADVSDNVTGFAAAFVVASAARLASGALTHRVMRRTERR
ncbi:MAG TPA: VanZ family protein [Candidatus Limnocylindrales bacterium]